MRVSRGHGPTHPDAALCPQLPLRPGPRQVCSQSSLSEPPPPLPLLTPCKPSLFSTPSISGGTGSSDKARVQDIGNTLLGLVKSTVLDRKGNAAFLHACHEHCGAWGQGQQGSFADFNVTINGMTAAYAMDAWFAGRNPQQLWLQNPPYPCDSCCSGGSH